MVRTLAGAVTTLADAAPVKPPQKKPSAENLEKRE